MKLTGITTQGFQRIAQMSMEDTMTMNNDNIKAQALATFLNVPVESIEQGYDDDTLETEEGDVYKVLTDSEADTEFEDSLDDYIFDNIIPELPEPYRSYFDGDKFKQDVRLSDGRGPILNTYDGSEEEVQIDGEWFFIYQID